MVRKIIQVQNKLLPPSPKILQGEKCANTFKLYSTHNNEKTVKNTLGILYC